MGVSTSSAGSLLLKRPFAVRDAKAVPAVRRLARAALVTMGIPPSAKAPSDASYVDAVDQSQLGESEAAVMLVPASVARISGPVAVPPDRIIQAFMRQPLLRSRPKSI